MSASLSCKFTCQEVWNSLELDGVNICARLGREGQQELLSPQPSPVPAGDARAGLVQPNVCPQPDRAASRQQNPKLARREAGAHPGRVLAANPLWGNAGGTGLALEGLLIPAPLHLPVIGSPNILGHYGAFPSFS